jgi:branched-chain amino acid transport system substrate-binding protein
VLRRNVVRNMVGAACILCFIVACSSSSSSSTSTTTSAAASGKTLTVEVPCQITGPEVEPECATSVEAYFDMINAAGGVNGYMLKVVTCDTQTNPVLDANCTKSAVANPAVVALVGRGGGIAPIPQYSIADIAPIVDNPAMATATNSFILTPYSASPSGDPGSNVTQQKLLAEGVNKPGIVACSLSGCITHVAGTKAWYAARGISVKVVTAALTAVDLTPQIVALQHADVNGIIVVEGAAGIDGAIKAAQTQGYTPHFLLSTACDDARALQAVPDVPNVYCSIPFNPSPAARSPYTQLMNKYIGAGKWAMSGWGLNSYLGAQLFVQDVRSISGPVTRAAILAGMRKITDFSSPLLGTTINFSKPGPIAKYPAFVNWYYYFSAIKNHSVVPVDPTAINAAP